MLNFILCDDNQNILSKLSKMLDCIFVNNDLDGQIALSTTHPSEVIDYVKNNPVDVLILDINFKEKKSGIDLANEIRNTNKHVYIIFATGHLEYLILAYKCKTFDYLPKPISMENLETTILRLFDDIKSNASKKDFIRINNKDTLINTDSIYYIEKSKNKIIFRTANSEYFIGSSFNKLLPDLPSTFVRCHKSYIVNVQNINSIENDTIYFGNTKDLTCYIGHTYKKNFMEVFNNEFNANTNI